MLISFFKFSFVDRTIRILHCTLSMIKLVIYEKTFVISAVIILKFTLTIFLSIHKLTCVNSIWILHCISDLWFVLDPFAFVENSSISIGKLSITPLYSIYEITFIDRTIRVLHFSLTKLIIFPYSFVRCTIGISKLSITPLLSRTEIAFVDRAIRVLYSSFSSIKLVINELTFVISAVIVLKFSLTVFLSIHKLTFVKSIWKMHCISDLWFVVEPFSFLENSSISIGKLSITLL